MCPVLGSNIHLMDGWQNVNSGWWQPAPDKWIRGLMISGGRVRNVLITVSVFLTPDSQCQSRSQQISPFTNVCSSSAGSLPPPATNWLTLSLNGPPRSRITGSRETITMVIRMRKVCRYLRQRAEVCCLFAWMIINGRCYPYLSHSDLCITFLLICYDQPRTLLLTNQRPELAWAGQSQPGSGHCYCVTLCHETQDLIMWGKYLKVFIRFDLIWWLWACAGCYQGMEDHYNHYHECSADPISVSAP